MAAQIVKEALEELETNITVLDLGKGILNTLIIFVLIFLLATIFHFSIYFAFIPSLVFFVFNLIFIFYKNKYIVAEEKVPELNERLRTVADNLDRSNPILDSLKEDVVRSMTRVKADYFIDYTGVAIRILFLTIISILVIIASFLNVSFDFNFSDLPIIRGQSVRLAGQEVADLNLTYLEGNLSDILGEKSIAKLGTKQLKLVINPLESDADINNIRQVKEQEFNPPVFPKEIYTSYDVAYNDRIAKENQKVVKNYFQQISR